MHLNVTHPNYDAAMELLCLASPGYQIPLELIASDLRLENQRGIRPLLERLNETHGLELRSQNAGRVTGRVLRVPRGDWTSVERLATEYWNAVYPADGGQETKP